MQDLPYENFVWTLAKKAGLATVRIPGSADANMTDYDVVFSVDGSEDGDPGRVVRQKANDAMDCVNATFGFSENGVSLKHLLKPDGDRNITYREGLQQCGWHPTTAEEFAVDWAMSGEDANGEPARISAVDCTEPDSTYQWWGPDDQFVVDQDPRGFAKLIDLMVNDTVPVGDPRILFNSTVTTIDYSSCDGVAVTTQDGRKFWARNEVISTLPLGVLHHKYVILHHHHRHHHHHHRYHRHNSPQQH